MKLLNKILYSLLIAFLLVGCGSGGGSGESSDTDPNGSSGGSTITVTTLAIAVPNFPRTELLNFLAGYNQVYTNQLITFPETPDNALVVDFFLSQPPETKNTHLIYILNGSGIRNGTDAFFGRGVKEEEANRLLANDAGMRDRVNRLFVEVVAYAKQLEALGVEVLISPELEDNLTDSNYRYLEQTLINAGWGGEKIMRNPVKNRVTTPGKYEVHPHSLAELEAMLSSLKPGDYVNTDGADIRKIPVEDLIKMKQLTDASGVVFWAWSDELQGYTNHTPFPNLTSRNYSFTAEYKAILEVLFPRDGSSVPTEGLDLSPREKIVRQFLWKPKSEGGGPGYEGKPVILVNPAGITVKVNGTEFENKGFSNGYAGTYRSNGRACNQYGQVRVEFFDSATGLPVNSIFGRNFEVIESPCSRKQW